MRRWTADRVTTPPRLVPLIPVCILGLFVGQGVYATAATLWEIVSQLVGDQEEGVVHVEDGELWPFSAYSVLLSVAWTIVASIGLRVVVRWWVDDQPPRPGPRGR